MRKHTNEKPYVCDICGKSFRQCTDLKGHQRTHSGDKPILCTICGKLMSTTGIIKNVININHFDLLILGQLTVHIRSHTGERPFGCSFCSKAFTTRTMLAKHKRIHTGERPYVCDICERSFNQSSTLKTHKKTHLKSNDKKKSETKPKNKFILNDQDKIVDATTTCVFYKEVPNIETEVAKKFISDVGENIEVLESYDSGTHQFTVVLPAPIPYLNNI